MKYRKLFILAVGLFSFLAVTSFAYMQSSTSKLILSISSPKNVYKLGEPISFSFELRNETNEMVNLTDVFGTGTGHLHLKVSRNNKDFVVSDDPDWGRLDVIGKTSLQSYGSAKSSGTVLWSLSSQNIPVFKFKESGTYYFKAQYTARIEGEKTPVVLESEPFK